MSAEWDVVERRFRGIFERRYFANHGPLVKELDERFAIQQDVAHAICVTNETVGVMILAKALAATGDVVVPAYTSAATLESLSWAGLTPILTDVDPASMVLTRVQAAKGMTDRTVAIFGIHLFGIACDTEGLTSIARERNCALLFDARDTVGCSHAGKPFGGFGDGEIFSFHETSLVNGGEGGAITTRDEGVSRRLRTMRNFHRNETFATVPLRMNGKMSEAQAALALCSLDFLSETLSRRRAVFEAYEAALAGCRGVGLVRPARLDRWNYGRVILDIDPAVRSPGEVIEALGKSGTPCAKPIGPVPQSAGVFPATEALRRRLVELPSGRRVSPADAVAISRVIERA